MEGKATVSLRMLMPAFEATASIAEQQRTRHQHRRSHLRAVLKASAHHRRDCGFGMLFDEGAVARPVVTHHVTDAPPSAGRQNSAR